MGIDSTPIIDLGTGALYLKPLDGGDPVRLGQVTEINQTAEAREEYYIPDGPAIVRPVSQSVEITLQDVTLDPVTLWRLTHDVRLVVAWAMKNRPKLWHLTGHAKTSRKRRKNARRILRDFFEEVNHGKN